MNSKAIALLSGGLDSTLAARLILDQGIEVLGFHLLMPWGCCDKRYAIASAGFLGIPLMTHKLGDDYIAMVRSPRYGYGTAMNPCVDCRIYIWKLAKRYMEKIEASFLITGEVLGQRPMSQMKRSMKIIEEESVLVGRILRPLSAKLLEPTLPELEGVVDRSRLLAFQGRSRREQMELARHYGWHDYPTPAGGCLLTDKDFAKKVQDLFSHTKENSTEEIELLTLGRHFRLDSETKIIVGRDEQENRTLEWYAREGKRHYLVPQNFVGPAILIEGPLTEKSQEAAARFALRYTRADRRPPGNPAFYYQNQIVEIPVEEPEDLSLLKIGA